MLYVPPRPVVAVQPRYYPALNPLYAPDVYYLPIEGYKSPLIEGGKRVSVTTTDILPVDVGHYGLGLKSTPTGYFAYAKLNNPPTKCDEVSMLAVVTPYYVEGSYGFFVSISKAGASTSLVALGQYTANTLTLYLIDRWGNQFALPFTPPANMWRNNKPAVVLAINSKSANTSRLYIDGSLCLLFPNALGGELLSDYFSIGGIRYTTDGNVVNAHNYLSAFWKRALSDQDAKAISANPWQIFL